MDLGGVAGEEHPADGIARHDPGLIRRKFDRLAPDGSMGVITARNRSSVARSAASDRCRQ
jgi:hypothetical protein